MNKIEEFTPLLLFIFVISIGYMLFTAISSSSSEQSQMKSDFEDVAVESFKSGSTQPIKSFGESNPEIYSRYIFWENYIKFSEKEYRISVFEESVKKEVLSDHEKIRLLNFSYGLFVDDIYENGPKEYQIMSMEYLKEVSECFNIKVTHNCL